MAAPARVHAVVGVVLGEGVGCGRGGECRQRLRAINQLLLSALAVHHERPCPVSMAHSCLHRWQGMFLERGHDPIIASIEARIAKWTLMPAGNGEGLQVLVSLRGVAGAAGRPASRPAWRTAASLCTAQAVLQARTCRLAASQPALRQGLAQPPAHPPTHRPARLQRYEKGQEYEGHYDYFFHREGVENGGNRYLTVLM